MSAGPKPITGRKVLVIAVAAFGVVIAANLTLMFAATGTFPGLVVKNSYVASQGWDRKVQAQRSLGWKASVDYADGMLFVVMTGPGGTPVTGLNIVAVVGRPATTREDTRFDLTARAPGYATPLALAPGRWQIRITGTDAAGSRFEATAELYVPKPG